MPPTTVLGAYIAGPDTYLWASNVGRICCGLEIPLRGQSIQPSLSAALNDVSFGLFITSMQYKDGLQRGYAVATLQAISEATGFTLSASFAAICEANWNMMADAERVSVFDPYMKSELVAKMESMGETESEVQTQPWIKTKSTEYVPKDGILPVVNAATDRYELYNPEYTKAIQGDKGPYSDNQTSEATKPPFEAEPYAPTSLIAEASHAEDDLERPKISQE